MSILKVDTINEKTSGNGVHIPGHVIATHKFISSGTSATAITSTSFTTLDTFNLTVKQDNSYMIWWVDTQQYIKSDANSNLNCRLQVDGVSVGSDNSRYQINQPGLNHVWYGFNSGRETLYNHYITPSLTAGSHTFTFDAARYNTGTITLKYQGGGFRYIVQEIAQ